MVRPGEKPRGELPCCLDDTLVYGVAVGREALIECRVKLYGQRQAKLTAGVYVGHTHLLGGSRCAVGGSGGEALAC